MRRGLILGLLLALCPIPAQASSCNWDTNAGWVQRENQKSGSSIWTANIPLRFSADYSRRKDVPRIEGFASTTSATCGEKVGITTIGSKRFELDIYRMGFYNNRGARLIRTLDSPTSIKVDSSMIPGQYLLKLRSKNRAASFIPLIVTGKISNNLTFVSSVLTWQSYNQWGGQSLYKGADGNRETKATSVTFDRPYDGDGSGQFRYMEQPLVTLMEKQGLDINYLTDFDVHSNSQVFASTQTIIAVSYTHLTLPTNREV